MLHLKYISLILTLFFISSLYASPISSYPKGSRNKIHCFYVTENVNNDYSSINKDHTAFDTEEKSLIEILPSTLIICIFFLTFYACMKYAMKSNN